MMTTQTHSKVSPEHLRRDAFLYVRQSTLRQVLEKDREYATSIRIA
jgi:hypothetical protein